MYLDGKYYKDHDTFLRDKRKAERKAPLELHLTLNSPWEYDPSTPIDDFADVEFSSQGSEMSAKMQRCSEVSYLPILILHQTSTHHYVLLHSPLIHSVGSQISLRNTVLRMHKWQLQLQHMLLPQRIHSLQFPLRMLRT